MADKGPVQRAIDKVTRAFSPTKAEPTGPPPFPWPDGRKAAMCLTFDDARLTQADLGIPLLNQFGVKGTFYVSFHALRQRLDAWRAAVAQGHEIGNHTVRHPCTGNFRWSRGAALEDFTLEQIEQDLLEANATLEEALDVKPRSFAYPCGQKFVGRGENARSYIPVVAKHFLVGRGFNDETDNDPWFCDLAQACAYAMDGKTFDQIKPQIDSAVKTGGWVIFVGHEMIRGERQCVRGDTLDTVCRYANEPANGIWCATVAEVGSHIAQSRRNHEP